MSVKEPAQRPAGRPRAISSPTPISISKVAPYGRLWSLWRRNWMLGMANQYWSPWAPSSRERKDRSWHGRNAACCLHSRQPFTPHCNRHLYQFTGRTSGPPLQCAYQKYFKCWNHPLRTKTCTLDRFRVEKSRHILISSMCQTTEKLSWVVPSIPWLL